MSLLQKTREFNSIITELSLITNQVAFRRENLSEVEQM